MVARPGRLVDLVQQGFVKLERVGIFVLDEADQMLDVGMIKQVKTVIAQLPKKRQNILFSATMPKEVTKTGSHPTQKSCAGRGGEIPRW